MSPPRLHVVSDDAVLAAPGFLGRARRLLGAHGGALALHVRGHGRSGAELFGLADALGGAGAAALLVNDRVDVALAAGADGVQLGRRSLPVSAARELLGDGALVGYSAHEPEEAAEQARAGADFVHFGTVYPSASHPERSASGIEALAEAAAGADVPVLAIGGVTPERAAEVLDAGASGVAVLSGVWHAQDPVRAAGRYLVALNQAL